MADVRGSMREIRPGYWQLRVSLGRDPITQKPKYRTRGLRATKREAPRALAQLGTDVTNGKMTLQLIPLLSRLDPAGRQQVEQLIRTGRRDASVNLRELINEHDSLGFAMNRAHRFVDEALGRLRRLLEPRAQAVVEAIGGFVLSRNL